MAKQSTNGEIKNITHSTNKEIKQSTLRALTVINLASNSRYTALAIQQTLTIAKESKTRINEHGVWIFSLFLAKNTKSR